MRYVLFLLVFFTASCNAALEEWSCQGYAFYHGLIAVDRDQGMPLKDRVNKTVNAIIKSMDAGINELDIEAYDARALVQVVYDVYKSKDSPKEIYYDTMRSCSAAPRLKIVPQQKGGGT